jgi:hypothetical protein
MSSYSPGRGRRKAVRRFTNRDGLWIVGIVSVILVGMLMLILLGYLDVNAD